MTDYIMEALSRRQFLEIEIRHSDKIPSIPWRRIQEEFLPKDPNIENSFHKRLKNDKMD